MPPYPNFASASVLSLTSARSKQLVERIWGPVQSCRRRAKGQPWTGHNILRGDEAARPEQVDARYGTDIAASRDDVPVVDGQRCRIRLIRPTLIVVVAVARYSCCNQHDTPH